MTDLKKNGLSTKQGKERQLNNVKEVVTPEVRKLLQRFKVDALVQR